MCLIVVAGVILAGCSDSTVQPQTELDGLPSDDELTTPEDPNAIPIDEAWETWINENRLVIRSLTSNNFSDLRFLEPLLADRRLVQLGESGHGVSEFNSMKTRLIKYLHEEMGFDVIAFESSVFECYYANRNADALTATELMQRSIFGVWHAEEVLELFEYIKATQQTSRPLTLAGFDIQISSFIGVAERHRFFRDMIDDFDPGLAARASLLDSVLVENAQRGAATLKEYLDLTGQFFPAIYEEMVAFFDANEDALLQAHPDDPAAVLIARQAAWSMIHYIAEIKALDNQWILVQIRDEAMAKNVDFLVDELYPNKKIMIWAHNFHIRHLQESVGGDSYNGKTMGTFVAQNHRPELYTIGFYMYRGRAAWNNRVIYDILEPQPNSVEAIFYTARLKYVCVEMLGQVEEEGNSWMFQLINAKTWGTRNLRMAPREQYDAIIFIDTVTPPAYVE
jgi:erythromycin esterase